MVTCDEKEDLLKLKTKIGKIKDLSLYFILIGKFKIKNIITCNTKYQRGVIKSQYKILLYLEFNTLSTYDERNIYGPIKESQHTQKIDSSYFAFPQTITFLLNNFSLDA